MMPPFVVFPTKRIAYFVEVSLYFILSSTTSDINKCHVCPYRNGCYKENAKTKTYSITIKSDYHKNQEAFQKTQYFKERFKTRYMIEAKNSELKNIHGYSRCDAAGLSNMQLQGAVSIFAVNLKRILKLKG